jgi:hypothetical protein
MLHLTVSSPQTVAMLQADSTQWRALLADTILAASPRAAARAADEDGEQKQQHHTTTAAAETAKAVADYMVSAWKLRSTALNGRETNGGDAMV